MLLKTPKSAICPITALSVALERSLNIVGKSAFALRGMIVDRTMMLVLLLEFVLNK